MKCLYVHNFCGTGGKPSDAYKIVENPCEDIKALCNQMGCETFILNNWSFNMIKWLVGHKHSFSDNNYKCNYFLSFISRVQQ